MNNPRYVVLAETTTRCFKVLELIPGAGQYQEIAESKTSLHARHIVKALNSQGTEAGEGS
jgi:hypothetical protein